LVCRSAVRSANWDVQILWRATAFGTVGQRSDGRIGIFRECFVVSSCLLAGRSAVRWADWNVRNGVFAEQMPFGWSFSRPMGGLGCSDIVLW
jgi:hypothetical protein